MSLSLSPASITRRLRRDGVAVVVSQQYRPGVVLVTLEATGDSAADAERARRLASAALLRAGYDTVARGASQLLVVLPEPADDDEEPAVEVVEPAEPEREQLAATPLTARRVSALLNRAGFAGTCSTVADGRAPRVRVLVSPGTWVDTDTATRESYAARAAAHLVSRGLAVESLAGGAVLMVTEAPAAESVEVTPEQVADAILDRRPILDLYGRPAELTREQADTVDAGVTLATARLADRYGVTTDEVVRVGREVIEETLAADDERSWRELSNDAARREQGLPVPEPGPEVDDPREQPAPVEWSETAAPVRFAVDADCPGCGYPERSFDPATGVFACSSLNRQLCDYTSTTRA